MVLSVPSRDHSGGRRGPSRPGTRSHRLRKVGQADLREAYTFAGQVAWIRHWIEALDLRDITLVCQDWGSLDRTAARRGIAGALLANHHRQRRIADRRYPDADRLSGVEGVRAIQPVVSDRTNRSGRHQAAADPRRARRLRRAVSIRRVQGRSARLPAARAVGTGRPRERGQSQGVAGPRTLGEALHLLLQRWRSDHARHRSDVSRPRTRDARPAAHDAAWRSFHAGRRCDEAGGPRHRGLGCTRCRMRAAVFAS